LDWAVVRREKCFSNGKSVPALGFIKSNKTREHEEGKSQ